MDDNTEDLTPREAAGPPPSGTVTTAPATYSDMARNALPVLVGLLLLVVGFGTGYAVGHQHGHSGGPERRAVGFGVPGRFGQMPGRYYGGGAVPGRVPSFLPEQLVRGTIAAISSSKITVKASNGTTESYAITGSTQIVRDGKSATVAELKAGDDVAVAASNSSGSSTAVRIIDGPLPTTGTAPGFGVPPGGNLPGGGGFGSAPSGGPPS